MSAVVGTSAGADSLSGTQMRSMDEGFSQGQNFKQVLEAVKGDRGELSLPRPPAGLPSPPLPGGFPRQVVKSGDLNLVLENTRTRQEIGVERKVGGATFSAGYRPDLNVTEIKAGGNAQIRGSNLELNGSSTITHTIGSGTSHLTQITAKSGDVSGSVILRGSIEDPFSDREFSLGVGFGGGRVSGHYREKNNELVERSLRLQTPNFRLEGVDGNNGTSIRGNLILKIP